ncbi:MAG TPA: hypothetical protein PK280_15460 [Planctomycetota bacterium]|nr:hypothetical protein [Planctomycetota bacterium]
MSTDEPIHGGPTRARGIEKVLTWAAIGLVLALVGGAAWDFFDQDDGFRGRISRRRWDVVIRALENFRHDKGAYPSSLDQLVPSYLHSIPKPLIGKAFEYSVYSGGESFSLEFPAEWGYYHIYHSSQPHWVVPFE